MRTKCDTITLRDENDAKSGRKIGNRSSDSNKNKVVVEIETNRE